MDILITKDIQNSWIFQDSVKLKWWLDLVLMAEENGEVHMSLSDLCHRWKAPKTTVHRFIVKLISGTVNGTKAEQQTERIIIHVSESYKGVRNDKWNESGTISGTPQESPLSSPSLSSPTPPSITPPIIPQENPPRPLRTCTHTREENFGLMVGVLASEEQYIKRYRQEGLWADAAMSAHLTIQQVQQIFDEFVVEQKHNSSKHSDYPDFKRHFLNYLRVKAVILRKQANSNSNGNQRKYDDRRGTEVSSSADYTKPL